ncbi:hypothetical protein [Rhodopseudomonas sp. BR0G17]|uniref:hypothetical protein n=1 Tax=Rhodopseudomonas sp. BR0G17 TaxID=2269368 RepID=UPI0013E09335|nr:hypothetical protein [Rhodopseudomonas sp. BR0G17]NEW96662.1 hypothetical protein [Rhodopseudomonas sp. BR0G17]
MNYGEINHNPTVTPLPATAGRQAQRLSGRRRYPLTAKINPMWWFQNDLEPQPPEWFKPGAAAWWRALAWAIRNPLSNFTAYVVGVKDRDYEIAGTDPLDAGTLADVGRTGWKWSVIRLGPLRLPFVGYAGPRVLFYAGWAWEGNLGAKFNLRRSSVQAV